MKKYKIQHISFLHNGTRHRSMVNMMGKFPLKASYHQTRSARSSQMTAQTFVKHPIVRDSDPVLNLDNGDKLRVYLGGDSSHMVVQAISVIETHDDHAAIKKKEIEKEKEKEVNKFDSKSLEGLFADFPEW